MNRASTRSALVTGASRGIGLGIATSLARKGFGLTITSRSAEDLEHLAARLQDEGSPTVAHRAADMSDRDQLPELIDLHERVFGSMSALVVNAGVGTAGPAGTYPLKRLDKTVSVNLVAPFVLTQSSLPLLRAGAEADPARGSKIIALSSITGAYAETGLAAYGATKAALLSLVDTLNAEESGRGVSATAIAPGYVETDMSAWVTDRVPAETMIRVSDIVRVVDMVLALSRQACITRVVISRSGTSGHEA